MVPRPYVDSVEIYINGDIVKEKKNTPQLTLSSLGSCEQVRLDVGNKETLKRWTHWSAPLSPLDGEHKSYQNR